MTDTRERVLEWLTSADTCYLIGAGCSRCAGKPLIGELTTNVLKNADALLKEQFAGLKSTTPRPPTIEDLINYLVRYQLILQTVTDPTKHLLQPAWIEASLDSIRKEIVGQVVDKWVESRTHGRFLQRLGGIHRGIPRDLFVLNYDTVIEATLDHLRFHYVDGFRGTHRGWFDSTIFDEKPVASAFFRLFKLHGSINWLREKSGHVRRAVITPKDDIKEPIVVYPSEQKYLQIQFGVLETLMGRFRARLRLPGVNNCLVALGYSFNDEHINEALVDAVIATGSNLTVVAFVGPDSDLVKQKERLAGLAARCDARFNVFVGKDFYIGTALDDTGAKLLLKEELWQFETLVDFIAGAAA